jgi:hypothetical protein
MLDDGRFDIFIVSLLKMSIIYNKYYFKAQCPNG